MRFTSPTEVKGKATTKVPLPFTRVNYISAKDLIEVRRLGGFRAETGSADISAPADISALKTVVLAFRIGAVALSMTGRVAVKTMLWGRNPWSAVTMDPRFRGGDTAARHRGNSTTRHCRASGNPRHNSLWSSQSGVVSSRAICYGSRGDLYFRKIPSGGVQPNGRRIKAIDRFVATESAGPSRVHGAHRSRSNLILNHETRTCARVAG